jgi:hypothetical protein
MSGEAHVWRLVAPWWSWQPADDPQAGRSTGALLQMFAADDFVDGFLNKPQHSLCFGAEDEVASVTLLGSALQRGVARARVEGDKTALPGWEVADAGRVENPLLAELQAAPMQVRLASSGERKLFLPLHGRHYLVSCELHCDGHGFPSVDPRAVCGSGFVVRRLSSPVPAALEPALFALQRRRAQAQAELDELQLRGPLRVHLDAARRRRLQQLEARGELQAARLAARETLAAVEAEFIAWKAQQGIAQQVEIWRADANDPELGEWKAIDAATQLTSPEGEFAFPLRRLHAPPDQPEHDAAGRSIYWGAVPTTSAQRDHAGRPRFDERGLYEIRCFVTRRRAGCTRPVGFSACRGERVWSLASTPYRLAAAMDPVGCARRPITIRMPDLAQLLAQAVARPKGTLSNVRVVHQQRMNVTVNDQKASGSMGGAAICHFSIPLITIVAMFVLSIFLPIVVLVMQLWYLLAFRFCIPPSVGLGGGVGAAAKITNLLPPSGDFSGGLTVDGVFKDPGTVEVELQQGLATQWGGDNGPEAAAKAQTLQGDALALDARNAMDNRGLMGGDWQADEPEPPMPGRETPPHGTPPPSLYLDEPTPAKRRPALQRA